MRVERQELTNGFQLAMNHALAPLEGKYADYIGTQALLAFMPTSLTAAKADFTTRLEVVTPIESDGRFYFGSGCQAHECTMNEAAWVIDKVTGESAAVIMRYVPESDGIEAHETFQLFGTTTDSLTKPLAVWAEQREMTGSDTIPETPGL